MIVKESDLTPARLEPESAAPALPAPSCDAPISLRAVVDKIMSGELTPEKLNMIERLALRSAEQQFAQAFIALQKELPTIQGFRGVPDKQGNIKFLYANFDDIDTIVRPICLRNGFSYSFRETGMENGRVTVTMTLTHHAGHSREIPFTVRVGSGPPGATESQADMSGHEYAKRGAIESGLALRIIGQREDPRMEGGPITAEQADELERRVALLNQPHDKFLKWLGTTSYKDIAAAKYEMADQFLRSKEKGSAPGERLPGQPKT